MKTYEQLTQTLYFRKRELTKLSMLIKDLEVRGNGSKILSY